MMTPTEFQGVRKLLGLTQAQLADALKLGKDGSRSVRRWEAGDRPISGPVEVAVRFMLERRDVQVGRLHDPKMVSA